MLDDGTCFEGEACGARREAGGEVLFTTGMAGYQETLTDPSFVGQLVTFTSAHIGNYGVTRLDDEARRPMAAGAVFHDLFEPPAGAFPHWRAERSLDQYLAAEGVTGIKNVDTRALTLHLRRNGVRNGLISALDLDRPSLLRRARELPPMDGRDLVLSTGCTAPYAFTPAVVPGGAPLASATQDPPAPPLHVVVIDYGMKRSIAERLHSLGMRSTLFPPNAPAKDILAARPDGVLLSNGPGDPEACLYAIATLRDLLGRVPLFGICLGQQLLGLALKAKTYKMAFGHHGENHPVKDLTTGRVSITSQNHGYCIDPDSLPANVEISHWNLNDNTVEGLVAEDLSAFSVQFHPEAAPGPSDAAYLFARFRDLILARKS